MIKPETQIEIGKITAGLFFCLGLVGIFVEFITPNVVKAKPTNEIPLILVFFMLLYGIYYFTLVKKFYKIHIAIWLIIAAMSIINIFQPMVLIVLFLLSQSVWGIVRLYFKSQRK